MNERRVRRKPGENRARLLEAGLIEFGLFGYHGASTSSIARRADVPQPHVYANFGSKQDLFLACLDELLTTAQGSADAANDAEVLDVSARLTDAQCLLFYQGVAAARTPELSDTLGSVLNDLHTAYGVASAAILARGAFVLLRPILRE